MSTHTHQVLTQRLHVPIDPEIVDDSEPERTEIRKTLQKRRSSSVEILQPNNFKKLNQIPVTEISGIT